jgi:GNAT superfamily N-acetyltransferase
MTADTMFALHGIVFPPGQPTIEAAVDHGAEVFVVGEPPIAFAALVELDGHPHLEQISVHADHGRQGIGSMLLDEVVRRAGAGVTLLTFRDIPWNGPWYAGHGFVELPEEEFGPELRTHWQAEIDAGLHALGHRVAMRHP